MSHRISRRSFLAGTGALAGAAFLAKGSLGLAASPTTSASPLRIGMIGVSGRGIANVDEIAAIEYARIVALCDVDASALAGQIKKHADAKPFRDFREMLAQQKDLDAVVISTPDHTHAIATVMALKAGKHVYCEKPLTHTVEEARVVTETARQMKRVTQLGTIIHAWDNYRRVVELIQAEAIGPVSEVHVSCGKNWGAVPLPATTATVPSDIDYDLWLGPTEKPYRPEYMHGGWRRWWTFGSGTLGDMGCHFIDLPFWALKLTAPTTIRAEGEPPDRDGCPQAIAVHYEFPAIDGRGRVKLSWYDGGKLPEHFKDWNIPNGKRDGVVFIGERGRLFADYDSHALLPADEFKEFQPPAPTIPKSIGHYREWVTACLNNDMKATTCNFDYAGPLTETVLLGAVAFRSGTELNWDAEKIRITNNAAANELLRAKSRPGWTL
jgi:predicted dehydrogenase